MVTELRDVKFLSEVILVISKTLTVAKNQGSESCLAGGTNFTIKEVQHIKVKHRKKGRLIKIKHVALFFNHRGCLFITCEWGPAILRKLCRFSN